MRIAICAADHGEREQLGKWLSQYCMLYGHEPETLTFDTEEAFFAAHEMRRFDVVFMGFGGPEGFLSARRLREQDKLCRIILIDDTETFAVKSVRIHASDFMLRPVDFKKVVRAMKLAGV